MRAEAGEADGGMVFDPGRGEASFFGGVHSDRLHKVQGVEGAPFAKFVGSDLELLAEGAGECLMRAIAGVERHAENVRRPFGQHPGRLGQAAAADVGRDGIAGGEGKDARQVRTRNAGVRRHLIQRQRIPKSGLDHPDGLGDGGHGVSS
jgi:hypothetical protein